MSEGLQIELPASAFDQLVERVVDRVKADLE